MRLAMLAQGWALVMLALPLGCTTPRIDPSTPRVQSGYCFDAEIQTRRGRESMTGCAESAELCAEAHRTAMRYGSGVNVERISSCERRGR